MQRLRTGPLVDTAGQTAEIWLDGGHNPAAGEALAAHLASLPERPTHLICGMLNTKDIHGYMRPLAQQADSLTGVSIPGEVNTLSATETRDAARDAGFATCGMADTVLDAVQQIAAASPQARILICGSLYLAGRILQENG